MRTSRRTKAVSSAPAIEKSGNCHVFVYVDTSGVAYALLYALRATGHLNDRQFREAMQILRQLYEKQRAAIPDPASDMVDTGTTPGHLVPPS